MSKQSVEKLISEGKDVFHSFCPYRVCPLGAHVDHQHGLVTGFAIDKGVKFDFIPTDDGSIEIYSTNYEGAAKGNVNTEYVRDYTWADFIFGAVVTLKKKYEITRGLKGIINGGLPVGGLSSSAAVILTYLKALCLANGIRFTAPEIIKNAIEEERSYIGVNVGKLDQSCEVYCRKDSLLYLDTQDDSSRLITINPKMPDFEIAVVFSGMERKLAGSAYNMRVDECKSASYALKAFAHLDYGKYNDTYLRDVPYGIFKQYKDQLPENWRKRAEHYYGENERVIAGADAFKNGDIEKFGKLMFESGRSSIELYDTGSPELKTLHEIMEQTDGIWGGRFSGAGFNGSAMAIVDPAYKKEITKNLTEKYLARFPGLKNSFGICFCRTTDGIEL